MSAEVRTPTSFQQPDGRWVHRFRQSFLNDVRHCPEQARQAMLGLSPEWDNDSALVGTLAHLAIEAVMREEIEDTHDGVFHFLNNRADVLWHDEVRLIHTKGKTDAIRKAIGIWSRWNEHIRHEIPTGWTDIEWQFSIPIIETAERTVIIQGTADLAGPAIYDWKTSARSFGNHNSVETTVHRKVRWEHDRYDVQPTMYSMAKALDLGVIRPDDLELSLAGGSLVRPDNFELPMFHYCWIPRDPERGDPGIFPVTVDMGDARALVVEMLHLATMIEARLPVWPLNPSDWWCSSKWCPVFASGQCRGAHLSHKYKNTEYMLNQTGEQQ